MDAHDAHGAPFPAGNGRLAPLFGLMAQPHDETVQSAVARLLKLPREIEQQHQVAPARVAVRHRAAERHEVPVVVNVPEQRAQLQIRRETAIVGQRVEKGAAIRARLRRGGERGVKIMRLVARAHGGEIVRREAEQRRAQHRDERHVLMRIVDHREQGEQHGHLQRLEEAAALLGEYGNSMRRERPAVHGADRVRAAQEDDDVAPVRRAGHAVIHHRRAGIHKRPDAPGDIVRLQCGLFGRGAVRVVRQREQAQLRPFAAAGVVRAALEPGVLVVVQLAQFG